MRVPLPTWVPLAASVLALLGPAVALAEEQAGHDRWVPSIAATSGFTMVGISGSVESFDSLDQELRPSADGRDYDVSPLLGADLELMSPELALPLSPRIFLSGEVAAAFGRERNVAREGSATGAEPPVLPVPPGQSIPGVGSPEGAFTGLGSSTIAQLQPLTFGAGLGAAFPFEWLDRPMKLKVSAEYLASEVAYDGTVIDAVCLPDAGTTQCNVFQRPPGDPPTPGFTREIVLEDSASRWYHAVGPTVELEVETGELRTLTHNLYVGVRGYRIIGDRGDRSTHLTDTRSYDDVLGQETYTANWDYKIDSWTYRITVGMRISFTGK